MHKTKWNKINFRLRKFNERPYSKTAQYNNESHNADESPTLYKTRNNQWYLSSRTDNSLSQMSSPRLIAVFSSSFKNG